jgi:SAM-dependent methyltransferase
VLTRLKLALLAESEDGNGPHPDPLDPAVRAKFGLDWSPLRRAAYASREMELFRDALRLPGLGVRESVLDDLSTHYRIDPEESLHRCRHWEDISVEEWSSGDRSTPEGLIDFYDSVQSWSFDLLWYAYLQASGFGYPESVVAASWLADRQPPGDHLDFGSGAGVTSQLMHRLGHRTTLADISRPLLSFARFRLDRREVPAEYIHLTEASLPDDSYDVITALDTLISVPDVGETARQLHRALRPGGYLVGNFDPRRKSERTAWHLYSDDLELRRAVQRAGFEPVAFLDRVLWIWRRVPTEGRDHQLRGLRDWALLASPPVRAIRTARHSAARAGLVAARRVRRGLSH